MAIDMTRRTVEASHIVIKSKKPFAAVRNALEQSVPRLDAEVPALIAGGDTERLRQRLEVAADLSIFLQFDHGALLRLYGKPRKAVQYLIGNPLTASTMTRYGLAAGLYVPLRVILYETDDGGSCFEYDLPSSLLGQFGDDRITDVARSLDVKLGKALSAAAG